MVLTNDMREVTHCTRSWALRVHESVMRSHTPFKGDRRDTVIFSLLPRELR